VSVLTKTTDSQLKLMAAWKDPPPLPLAWHRRLNAEIPLVRDGKCCAAIVGHQGTGKTFAIGRILESETPSDPDSGSDLLGGGRQPVVLITAASATKPKDGLRLILPALRGWPISVSEDRRLGEAAMVSTIVDEMQSRGVRLLIIDEAQLIETEPLDQVRLIYDECRSRGHAAGILFVGTPRLEDHMSKAGLSGQRVPRPIRAGLVDLEWLVTHAPGLHPLMPQIARDLGADGWKDLLQRINTASGGKMRRLVEVLRFANAVALKQAVLMAEAHIDIGIQVLATDSSRR